MAVATSGEQRRRERLRSQPPMKLDSEFAAQRMAKVDALPPETRAVVHVAGWGFVAEMLQLGVKSAKRMWHVLEVARGTSSGDEGIRDSPNEAEIEFIAIRLARAYDRPNQRPRPEDVEAAKLVAGAVWKHLRWGRCMCFGTLPIVYKAPEPTP